MGKSVEFYFRVIHYKVEKFNYQFAWDPKDLVYAKGSLFLQEGIHRQ
jgi:hypothetical protein